MNKVPFDEKELEVVAWEENPRGRTPVYNTPVTRREAYVAAVRDKDPYWIPIGNESTDFCPSVIPDNIARGFVHEGRPWPEEYTTYKDMFGIEWVYVPQVGGSMVKPGNPLMEDVFDWKEKVVFPDIDSWDWAASAEMNKDYLAPGKCRKMTLLNGCWFERLISFMDFENAAMALIDDEQIPYLQELLHETTNLYIRLVDKVFEYYDLDGIQIHDDWGSQRSPFFSEAAAREVMLPEMKRLVEHVHAKGKFIELHSCGHNEERCNIFAEAGFDAWSPMDMNDTTALYDTWGDKIGIGVYPEELCGPLTDLTPEQETELAKKYAERYTAPGKVAILAGRNCSQHFKEEVYKYSRIALAAQA